MERLCCGMLVFLALVSTQAQQGAVTFGNSASSPIRAYGTNLNATVALYGSTATNLASDSSLTQIGATVNTFAPGLFSGGTRNIGAPGDIVTLQVRAWTGGFASWDLALVAALGNPNIAMGRSPFWVQPVGGHTLPTQPITGVGRFPGIYIEIIPEPASVALAVLGALVIGFCARRKA